MLSNLNSQYNIAALLKAFFKQLIPTAIKQGDQDCDSSAPDDESDGPVHYLSLLKDTLAQLSLPKPLSDIIAKWVDNLLAFPDSTAFLHRDVLEGLIIFCSNAQQPNWERTATVLLQHIERRFVFCWFFF
jgi:hypothetical protein